VAAVFIHGVGDVPIKGVIEVYFVHRVLAFYRDKRRLGLFRHKKTKKTKSRRTRCWCTGWRFYAFSQKKPARRFLREQV
jgi:hypothetical protein